MPHVVTHAENTNDFMHASCDTHTLASQSSLGNYDTLEITYMHAVHLT